MEHSWNRKTKISMIRLNFINLIHEILSNRTIDKRRLLFQASKCDGNKLTIYIVNVRLNFNDVTTEYRVTFAMRIMSTFNIIIHQNPIDQFTRVLNNKRIIF